MAGIIEISVGIQSAATPRTSFGVPLILDHENVQSSAGGAAVVDTYGSLAEMAADGWESYHAAYKMAQALLAQQPRVKRFKVAGAASGTEATDLSDIHTADPDWYCLLYTSRVAADIKAAAAWIESVSPSRRIYIAETNDATAKAAGVSVLSELHALGYLRTACVYHAAPLDKKILRFDKVLDVGHTFDCKVNGVALAQQTYAVSHAATMDAIAVALAATTPIGTAVASVSDEAGLGAGVKDIITIEAASAMIDQLISEIVVGGAASPAVVSVEQDTAGEIPADAAWAGKLLPQDPGSATWAHKTLATVLPDTLTTANRTAIENQNGNWYGTELGFDIAFPGTMVGDSSPGTPMFIDLIQGADALESDLQTALMNVLNQAKKVPYTDQGVAQILSAATRIESKYVGSGFLVQKPFDETYEVPAVADADATDKSNRILRGLRANFQTAGAIHVIAEFDVTLAA